MELGTVPKGEQLAPRQLSVADVEAIAARHRTWGRWGEDDQLGAANFLTDEHVRRAATLVRTGKVYAMSLPFDRQGPQRGHPNRVNPQHFMFRHGGDMEILPPSVDGLDSTDDAIYMPLQCATQWDAFCHAFYKLRTYNNRGPDSVNSSGAVFNSITNILEKAAGRGVLLDIPRWLGRDWLESGESIQAEHLEACASAQGVEVGTGDFVLVRTGQLAERRNRGDWGDFAGGPAPGLGVGAADFLCPREVVAVATDTWGIEALPYESADLRAPLHVVLLVNAGVYIGEMWDMERLAEDCAADGVYEFMLVAPPLNITGAVGSPLTPIAIK